MAHLFEELTLRSLSFPNRIAVSPMCQYACEDGLVNDWHLVHLGSRAVGGAGIVFVEASAVLPEGRISPQDVGLWNDTQIDPLARIVEFIHEQGCLAGIQLAHAGRKASTRRPWDGDGVVPEDEGGWWNVFAPSALRFAENYPMPREMTEADIRTVVGAFATAAGRALTAGFDVVEVHAAHGYLLHEFLSPLSNQRTDAYGGPLDRRMHAPLQVIEAVRHVWPERLPLFLRISTTDWTDGGWDLDQSIELVKLAAHLGVDLVDCSSGGNVATAHIPVGPGYQTAFAERIREATGVPTGAVGMIVDPAQADHVIRSGQADMVFLARELLRDPYWPLRAARALGAEAPWPAQYLRAGPHGALRRHPVGT